MALFDSEVGVTTAITRLRGPENYSAWLMDVELSLMTLELHEYVHGTIERPLNPPPGAGGAPLGRSQAQKDWDKQDLRATRLLIQTLSDEVKELLTRAGWNHRVTSKETFAHIQRAARQLSESTIGDTMIEFFRLEAHNFESLDAYSKRLRWCWRQLTFMWPETNEQMYVHAAVHGLKTAYPQWCYAWELDCEKNDFPTNKAVIDRFLQKQAFIEKNTTKVPGQQLLAAGEKNNSFRGWP